MATRADSRRYRKRRAQGIRVARITVDEVAVSKFLEGAGYLRPQDEDDRARVDAALAVFLVAVTRDDAA